jgi:transcriptional regulator with XRE-family HTH domain
MGLTPQQVKAVQLLAKGHSQQEVADAIGVSRRTISRWLKAPEFKNLSFGLVNQHVKPQPDERSSQRKRQSGSLSPEDLIQDALSAVRDILNDPEARTGDRIKAAALVGQWAGLGQPGKMVEMEALKVLVEANWCPDEVLEVLINAGAELEEKIKNALAQNHQNGQENGHKKALPQLPKKGFFDQEDDDGFDEDE